eukprot:5422256-Karenia_brevis.AAC.1
MARPFWKWPAIASCILRDASFCKFQNIIDQQTAAPDGRDRLQSKIRLALDSHLYNDALTSMHGADCLKSLLIKRCNKYLHEPGFDYAQ